ncbi:MAG: sigma-54-dependent Fis family transcriptional regulator [Thermodesulfobacteriota bacterium]|nr:sigma-54-dependent Fis family transcriptional regulator [Thermodesulfobacteriota bacterium]
MDYQIGLNERLAELKTWLEKINNAWTVDHHESMLQFFVNYIPRIIDAERCSIFVADDSSDKLWLKYGSGLDLRELEAPVRGSVVGESVFTGKTLIHNDLDKQDGFHTIADRMTQFKTRNLICVPIKSLVNNTAIGAIEVLNKKGAQRFSDNDSEILNKIEKFLALALENSLLKTELLSISDEISNNIEVLKQERIGNIQFVATSEKMRALLDEVERVSRVPVNILVTGESGTGKELISRLVHQKSSRHKKRFVAVNCSSIPENLMESEFFGHTRGAFTGASAERTGRFKEAEKGFLFLDEIADMPLSIQPKFLRALQEKEGSKVGSNQVEKYDFRLISATSRNMNKAVEKGTFREDLYYRIFSVELHIPPLRERKADIIPLCLSFSEEISKRFNKKNPGFDPHTLLVFEAYHWPGNVRQLHHEIERLMALTPEGEQMKIDHCSPQIQSS